MQSGGPEGQLIYQHPVRRWVLALIVVLPGLGVLIAFLQEPNWRVLAAMLAFVWGIGLAGIWFAVRVLGRGRLTALWLQGDTLIGQRAALFGPGETVVLPLRDLSHWRRTVERMPHGTLLGLAFDHAGRTYRLGLTGAAVADQATLARLAGEVAGAPQAVHQE